MCIFISANVIYAGEVTFSHRASIHRDTHGLYHTTHDSPGALSPRPNGLGHVGPVPPTANGSTQGSRSCAVECECGENGARDICALQMVAPVGGLVGQLKKKREGEFY